MRIEDIIGNVNVYGFDESIRGAKFPKAVDVNKCNAELTDGIRALGRTAPGTGHNNFLKGIVVQFDLTFTVKAWVEAERYHWLDFVSSQSTMHKITKFNLDGQYIEYVEKDAIERMKRLVEEYNVNPTPDNYLRVLYNNPVGCKLTARMTTNYLQLKTIYGQRKTHRLPEWRVFCSWLETLPYANEFITNTAYENEG